MRRNYVYAAITSASAGLLFALTLIAAKTLSVDDFGRFQWVLRLAILGEAIMDLGLHQITVRAIARDRSDAARLLSNSLALKALPALAMVVVMTASVYLLRDEADVRLAGVLMIGSAVFRSYLLTARGVFMGLERFGHDTVVVVTDRLLLLVAGALALQAGGGLLGLAAVFVVARFFTVSGALIAAQRLVGRAGLGFDYALWRQMQATALPLGVFLVVLNLYSYIDTVMLGVMSTDEETGMYGAAYNLYEGLSFIPAAIASVLAPRLSHLWATDRAAHRTLARQGLLRAVGLAAVAAVPVWLLAPMLLSIYNNPLDPRDYRAASAAFRILTGGLFFIFPIWILQTLAMSVFRERMLLATTTVGVALNAALNWFWIPDYGRDGAALATLLGEMLTMTLLFYGLRDVIFGRVQAHEGPAASDDVEFGNLEANVAFIDAAARVGPDDRVLEIGSGRGSMLRQLRARGLRAVGLDVNRQLLAEARTRGALPVALTAGTGLPFPDCTFDAVMSFDVLEHIRDTDAHLVEVRRVLKPGGVYLLQTPNKWTNTVFETIRWKSFTAWRADHCSLHTASQLERRLRAHGFEPTFADVAVVTPFFREKVRRHLGAPGALLLAIANPDRLPRRWRTNFYVRAVRLDKETQN
ncbi:MAG TPA: oligosaccharide flippase family protein [Vicinamibacterales bacterium]|nr:oligosaccharide flippase family protein [Vicinamibacterales bacterium]